MQDLVITGNVVGLGNGVRNHNDRNIGSFVGIGILFLMLGSCLRSVFLHRLFLIGNLNLIDGNSCFTFGLGLEGQGSDLGIKLLVSTAANDADRAIFCIHFNPSGVRLDCAVVALILQLVAVVGQGNIVGIVLGDTGIGVTGDLYMDNGSIAILCGHVSGSGEIEAHNFLLMAPLALAVHIVVVVGSSFAVSKGGSAFAVVKFAASAGHIVYSSGSAVGFGLQVLLSNRFLIVYTGMDCLEVGGNGNLLCGHGVEAVGHAQFNSLAVDIELLEAVTVIGDSLHKDEVAFGSFGDCFLGFVVNGNGTALGLLYGDGVGVALGSGAVLEGEEADGVIAMA